MRVGERRAGPARRRVEARSRRRRPRPRRRFTSCVTRKHARASVTAMRPAADRACRTDALARAARRRLAAGGRKVKARARRAGRGRAARLGGPMLVQHA